MKIITKKYKVFDIADLKKDDELCNTIYQKFWLESEDNVNPWADENLKSFKTFADCLGFNFDCSLSYGEYQDRGCYIKLTPNYDLDKKDYREALENYTGNGYCFCDDLKNYADKLISEWHKDYSIDDFAQDIKNKMFKLWFADNKDYFSKETFLECVELNGYEFDENNQLI
tara:strand:+ start:448 stop:960 length:513 start_codon:yes stop_codon:yes gene_type:complete